MNVTIVSSFDVNDHRVELLPNNVTKEGHRVSVLLPDFRHTQKCRRTNGPKEADLLSANVIFHGEVYSMETKQSIFDRCHCGLNLLKAELSPERALKSTNYLKASLPVINNVRGAMWDFVKKYPVGLNYGGGVSITRAKLLAPQGWRKQIQALYDTCFADKVFSIQV